MFAKGHNIEKWLFYNLQKQNKPKKKEHLFIRLYTFEGQNWKQETKKRNRN